MRSTRRWKSAPNHPWQRPSAVPRPWTPHNNLLHIKSVYAVLRIKAWGFFGTMNDNAEAAWPIAMTAISDATYQPLESVRLFLDSRYGRHFADDVINEMLRGQTIQQAIDAAVTRWMGWTIGRQTSKQYGIPKGLPYLTGFVIHCEVTDESFEAEAA